MQTVPCPHFLRSFSDFIDHRLPPGRRMELQAHLDTCEPCLRHLAAYRRGVMVFRALETDTPAPGTLFESVERRLYSEGDSVPSLETGPKRGAPARSQGLSWRTIGTGLAAVLAFLLVRADASMPDPAATLTSTISTVVQDTPGIPRRSIAPVRVPSEPIEIDPPPATRPARVATERRRMVDPFDLVIERRLAEMEGRLRRTSWPTPGSVTEGWSRPRIGGALGVTAASASPMVYTVASADVSPPWSMEAAIVVP